MNTNQRKVMNKLNDMFCKGEITFNKYREILDICLAALEEPAQASEPTQVFDEMHSYPFITKDEKKRKSMLDKVKGVFNSKGNVEFEPFKPMGGIVAPYDINYVPIQASMKESVDAAEKEQMYKHKTNVFVKETEEKDEYAAALEEWQASFEKWKESQTLSFERMNEIADKVNKIYAVLNERVHPLVKRIDNDVHQVKKQTEASVNKSKEQGIKNKTLDDYPLTERQLKQVADYVNVNLKINSDTNINDLVKQLKDEIAKDLKETRLKGKLY